MNRLWMIIFSLLPLAGLAYALWRTYLLLPFSLAGKLTALLFMGSCFALLFCQFLADIDRWPMPLATAAYEVGVSSVFILLYLVILYLVLQIGEVVHLIPRPFLHDSWAGTLTVATLLTTVFTYGYIHYMHKERVPVDVTTAKALRRPLKIVMLSDLHLGYHNRKAELQRWVRLINAEHPDLVLIAGDIIDRSLRPLDEEHMAEDFHHIQAPVVACLGNHEYYGDIRESLRFYHDTGITLLRDSAVTIGDVNVIGRDDRMNGRRKSLAQLMAGVDRRRYTIVLDHQPYHLEEAERLGADFQLSGHTHYGQVWPISWITDAIYEDAWGPLQKGHTQYYVSSGMGIWGAKFRIGTQSEYVILTLKSEKK